MTDELALRITEVIDLSSEAAKRLDAIKRLATVPPASLTPRGSDAEHLENALRVYEWVVECQSKGLELGTIENGELIRIVFVW